MFLASFLRTGNRWICFLVNFWEQKREDCNCSGKILYGLYTDYIQPMIAEKYRSLSRWTRKMSELWLVNELDEKCSKQERLLIIIWILWFQVWHKYRNNSILTSLREWLIFTRRERSLHEQPKMQTGFLREAGSGCGGLLQDQGWRMRREK